MGAPLVISEAPNVALIGTGFIAAVHAEALRRLGIPVVGLLGSNPDRARLQNQRLGIAKVYDDLDHLINDPDVQALHIASPNGAHFEQARRALETGRHVVCEKPLAVRGSETYVLRDIAMSHPRLAAAVNYNIRFYPLCQEMRARIARGEIGRVLTVTGSYTQDWLLSPDDYNWRVEADGGTNLRAVADIGTHWLDLAQFVTGSNVHRVLADLVTFHETRNRPVGPTETFTDPTKAKTQRTSVQVTTEDFGAVLLRMAGGIHGQFHVSQTFAGRKNRLLLEVAGTEGSMVWDSECPDRLWIGRRFGTNEILVRDPALLSPEGACFAHYPGGHVEGFPDSFLQLYRSVYQWIASGSPPGERPFPTFEDGHREVRLCEAIAESAKSQRWVDVVED